MLRGLAATSSHVRAWYCYAFAAEVFSACALAIFLPITLEHMARDVGFVAPDLTLPCAEATFEGVEVVCKARIMGVWVDSASFSMYVKSVAVAAQALCIISIGPLANQAYWRKRILLTCAYAGSASGILFFLLPSVPLLAALLTIIGNACYATSIVCANAFLPGLAREDKGVKDASAALAVGSGGSGPQSRTDPVPVRSFEEARSLLGDRLPHTDAIAAISPADLAKSQTSTVSEPADPHEQYATLLSLTTSRLSSTGTAVGFLSGVSVLTLMTVPVTLLGGSTFSLKLAVGLSAIWWGLFTFPAGAGLPDGAATSSAIPLSDQTWLATAWKGVGRMISVDEIRKLPNLFMFLLAWIFLSDGFHTTTYTAILYASSTLGMPAGKIILIGILVQLAAVVSSLYAPRLQERLGYSNHRLLLALVLAGEIIPVYACLGLVLPFGGLRTEGEMYIAAIWFGMLYGPFNSYSRAVYAELIPPGHESTFFSLFSLTDKSASFFGPLVVGLISDLTGNIRFGFVFLLLMLAVPVPVLLRVRADRGRAEARLWASECDPERDREVEDVALLHA